MSIYLDRFLNVPAVPLPEPEGSAKNPGELLEELVAQLDRQQRVNEAGILVAHYLYSGASASRLLVRSQIQTYQIARRLYRGEHLYEEP